MVLKLGPLHDAIQGISTDNVAISWVVPSDQIVYTSQAYRNPFTSVASRGIRYQPLENRFPGRSIR